MPYSVPLSHEENAPGEEQLRRYRCEPFCVCGDDILI